MRAKYSLIDPARPAAILLSAALILASGCSGNDPDPTTPDPNSTDGRIDFESEFGGFDSRDEAPAFGDASLAASLSLEATVDDPAPAGFEAGMATPGSHLYSVTIRWGVLGEGTGSDGDADDPLADPTDWSGSLEVSRGQLQIVRVIAWEREDRIELPRNNPALVEWTSTTHGDYDGIRVLVRRLPSRVGDPDGVLTFETPLVTQSFAIADLGDLDLEIETGNGNGEIVRFEGWEAPRLMTSRGFLGGSWGSADDDSVGHFAGRWIGVRGEVAGFVRGVYGQSNAGEKLFFGKYIDRSGNFQGFVRGHWATRRGVERDGGSIGSFRGEWLDDSASPERIGALEGVWRVRENGRGAFDGRWCVGCP